MPFITARAADGGGQSLRMGVKFTFGANVEAAFELGMLDSAQGESEHAIQFGGALRW